MINNRHLAIITDDPVMAAILSTAFIGPGKYVPVFESPRIKRPDADNEITVLINAMKRIDVREIVYCKVDTTIPKTIAQYFDAPYETIDNIEDIGDDSGFVQEISSHIKDSNAATELFNYCSPHNANHRLAVIITNTNEVDSVIAANYAIARNADFFMIDVPKDLTKSIIDKLNKVSSPNISSNIRSIDLQVIKNELATYLQDIDLSKYSKVLFISDGLPFGLVVPEIATAHLPKLKLGIAIAGNLGEYVIALHKRHAFNGTILINRELDTTKEEEAMSAAILRTNGLVKTEALKHAKLSELEVEIFPYDVLYIATHGSQIIASRETYEFTTDDKITHEIVVDIGRGTTGEVHYIVSVDNINKSSPKWTQSQGEVWAEYTDKVIKLRHPVKPIKKPDSVLIPLRELQLEPTKNGMGSGNAFNSLAGGYLPLVIVNACGSWNELNGNFMYAGCSSFVGTLLPVLDSTASTYGVNFFENLFKEELINVAHKAKQSLPDEYSRSLYQFSGTFESKFDFSSSNKDPNGIVVLQKRIDAQINKIRNRIKELKGKERPEIIDAYKVHLYFLNNELREFNEALDEVGKNKI